MGPLRIGFRMFVWTAALLSLAVLPAERAQAGDPPALAWEARYNHPFSEDWGKAVITDPAGNIYVTGAGYGYARTLYAGDLDFVTVKYDPNGTEVWKALYGAFHFSIGCSPTSQGTYDGPVDIAVDGAGNVYVTGISTYGAECGIHGEGYTRVHAVTAKYDPNGFRMWLADIDGAAAAMALDEDGNVFVTGTVYWFDEWGYGIPISYVTAKFDTFGQKRWSVTYEGPTGEYNYATDIALDGMGFVHVTGRSQGNGTGYDYATIKYSRYGQELWVKRYNGPADGDDSTASIFVNSSGDIFVTGSSQGTGTGKDYATVKYDWFGNEVWVARYNGPADSDDEAVALAVDDLGSIFVTGTSEGLGSGSDIVTVKYDDLGNEDWAQRYDGPPSGDDEASSLTLTASGDVAVTGTSEGTDSAEDYVTIRYGASSGAEEWTARYDGPPSGEDAAASVASDGSGNVIVTGHSHGTKTGPDYATVKYDAGGSEVWAARFENPGMGGSFEVPAAMALDPSGSVCVTGVSCEVSLYGTFGPYDYATVKYGPEGNELWAARYDGPAGLEDWAYDLAVDAGGNVYVTGSSEGSGTGSDYATIKYAPTGSELWIARYDGPASSIDGASDLAIDLSGNVYVTGSSGGSGTGSDYATIKYDPAGNELWVARYNGPEDSLDKPCDLALDASGNVYVTGRSKGSGASYDYDYATVKYDTLGNEVWVARYDPGTSYDYAVGLDLDASGNVYVTGSSYSKASTIKYDPDGNELWAAEYSGSPEEHIEISTIQVDASGSAYIAGDLSWYDEIHYEYFGRQYLIVKYDALGNMDWDVLYEGPHILELDEGSDAAVALLLDDAGGIYVTGYSEFEGTLYDFATLKYSHDLTCNDLDGDGYGSPGSPGCTYPERDCDDTDPGVNPGDPENDWEECHNGIDDDCDGIADFCNFCVWFLEALSCPCDDSDGDGYGEGEPDELGGCGRPGQDCDDTRPMVNPGASEVPRNWIDDDCDGEVDEVACFIATAVFGPDSGARIEVLRGFRDEVLMGIPAGRAFVETYYELSPPVADFIEKRGWLRVLVRTLLLPLIGAASLVV